MFRVTLDVFCGRPNPTWMLSWEEGEQLVDRIANGGARVAPYDPYDPRFGIYQGFLVSKAIVSVQGTGLGHALADLPNQFRVIGDKSLTSEEEAWLLKTAGELLSGDPDLLNALWSTVELSTQFNQSPPVSQHPTETVAPAACYYAFTGNTTSISGTRATTID